MRGFHDCSVDLCCINRAHIVLLPKGEGVLAPGGFRPISLQNGDVKIQCKVLTTRLQQQIADGVDIDQSGLIRGQSISENFVFATEIMQCCQARRAPALVLKLDFAKAFDSINWRSLRRIMETDGGMHHPLVDDASPLVLQYADDTIIIMRAELGAVQCLKGVLDDFAAATELVINFSKSTVVPVHVPDGELLELVQVMGCAVGSFPQRAHHGRLPPAHRQG
nr:uncharacterized protein LOC120968669 [Aegilops tauschii subsp. strangulata]